MFHEFLLCVSESACVRHFVQVEHQLTLPIWTICKGRRSVGYNRRGLRKERMRNFAGPDSSWAGNSNVLQCRFLGRRLSLLWRTLWRRDRSVSPSRKRSHR
eukprot:3047598-Rhodomonas_salina.4